MGSLQRIEQETFSSLNLVNAIENMNSTRIDATGNRLRLKDAERLYPKCWSRSTSLAGFGCEIAAWLGLQQTTKGTLRATEAWTDGCHAEDDKYVELDYDLAVALVSVTEGAARSAVLKVTQVEPSHGFVTWQALVDGYTPKSSNDPARALQPILATPKRCKDAKE